MLHARRQFASLLIAAGAITAIPLATAKADSHGHGDSHTHEEKHHAKPAAPEAHAAPAEPAHAETGVADHLPQQHDSGGDLHHESATSTHDEKPADHDVHHDGGHPSNHPTTSPSEAAELAKKDNFVVLGTLLAVSGVVSGLICRFVGSAKTPAPDTPVEPCEKSA